MAPLLGIFGTGGCGRGIMPFARTHFARSLGKGAQVVFIDDSPQSREINGHPVVDFAEFLCLSASVRFVNIAVAAPHTRARLWARCESEGLRPWPAVADSAIQMDDVRLAPGAALSPFTTIASNVKIGRHFHANLYSYVEHDCDIGDFVTFAPGAKCNGNVVVEDYVYVGSGAIIRQGAPGAPLVIGAGATIGMGAVVLKSVESGSVVVGNPARRLR